MRTDEHYKAASERTDADERALIPAIRRTNKPILDALLNASESFADPAPNKAQPQHLPEIGYVALGEAIHRNIHNDMQQWTEQAKNAIRQDQSLNEFILHCHPDNRREARKAYMRLIVRAVNHADKLAEALRELTGMVERYKDAELRMEPLASYYNALDVLDTYEAAQ